MVIVPRVTASRLPLGSIGVGDCGGSPGAARLGGSLDRALGQAIEDIVAEALDLGIV